MTPEPSPASTAPPRAQVVLAYVAFVFVGVSAGVGGVALPAQMADYGVDRTTIGLTFFTFSAGFLLAGFSTGHLVHKFGLRVALVLGASVQLVAALATASRPTFAVLVLLGIPAGYATGLLESGLNTQLAQLPGAGALLNRLHAFFGVGALIGPLLASRLLQHYPWTSIWLVLALATVPLLAGFLVLHPAVPRDRQALVVDAGLADGRLLEGLPDLPGLPDVPALPDQPDQPDLPDQAATRSRGLLETTVREPTVILGAILLTTYVGAELSVGTWAYSYLVEERSTSELVAGNLVSGYWLGLTLGRFLIMSTAERHGWTTARATSACLLAVIVAALVVWLVPVAAVTALALGLVGFFLGPIFPTIMAATPAMTEASHVPTAIGVLNGVSLLGGSVLPWFAGFLSQRIALWTLWPFAIALTAVQLVIWRMLVKRLRDSPITGFAR